LFASKLFKVNQNKNMSDDKVDFSLEFKRMRESLYYSLRDNVLSEMRNLGFEAYFDYGNKSEIEMPASFYNIKNPNIRINFRETELFGYMVRGDAEIMLRTLLEGDIAEQLKQIVLIQLQEQIGEEITEDALTSIMSIRHKIMTPYLNRADTEFFKEMNERGMAAA
jgi:hypothetical protein